MKKTLALFLMLSLMVSLVPMTVSALPNSFTLNKLSGGTFTEKDLIGDVPTVMIFGQLDENQSCYNTNHVIAYYVRDFSGKNNLRVVVADITNSSKAVVQQYADEYDSEDFLTVCYGYQGNDLLWSMVSQFDGNKSGITTPYTVIFDKNGNYAGSTFGLDYEEQLNILMSVDSSVVQLDSKCTLSFVATERYKDAHKVFEMVNKERVAAGVGALAEDDCLSYYAMARAAECAVMYSHTRPNGQSCFSILPYPYNMGCGENIAYSYPAYYCTPEDIMDLWMNSSGHRANILDGNFSSVGIGCCEVNDSLYWVQIFSCADNYYPMEEYEDEYTVIYNIETTSENVQLLVDTHGNSGYLESGETATFDLCHKNIYSGKTVTLYKGSYGIESSSGCVTVKDNTLIAKKSGKAVIEYYVTDAGGTEKAASVKVNLTVTAGEEPVRVTGDIDGDGKVNVQDSLILKKLIVGKASVNQYKEYGDVNGDSKINVTDTLLLRWIIVGKA